MVTDVFRLSNLENVVQIGGIGNGHFSEGGTLMSMQVRGYIAKMLSDGNSSLTSEWGHKR